MRSILSLFSFFAIFTFTANSQEKLNIKFGKITADDFAPKTYTIDSSADAVIIADIGSSEIVGNSKGGFSVLFKNFRRARIMNKNGYDLADIEIPIYKKGDNEEQVKSLRAVTYNLENGKVVETKLDLKTAVFKDNLDKNISIKKFTFPNVKEGSIIEYEYKLESSFLFNLQPWAFQGREPRLWSEYTVSIPEFIDYVTLTQGYQTYYLKDKSDKKGDFTVSGITSGTTNNLLGTSDERTVFYAGITDFRWVMKDVPGLMPENYTSTIRNHISKIEFQLSELREPFTPQKFMNTWEETFVGLLKADYFGFYLDNNTEWMDGIVGPATGNITESMEKARRIYSLVRDNMTCTDYSSRTIDRSLQSVWKSKTGNVAEINLLLTALLRKAYINADPVLLSTRSHGVVYAQYPLLDKFNYVITQISINGKPTYLDASNPSLGFGKLNSECYNGHARVVNREATALEFAADSLKETKMTSIFLVNSKPNQMSGSMNQTPGFFESYSLRNRIKSKGKEQLFTDISKAFNADIEIKNPVIDSLGFLEHPIAIHYEFSLKNEAADIYYLNPMFGEGWKENPFKSAHRLYPVEMPYAMDETYLLRMDVPAGYEIDELPKQVKVKLNNREDGAFEYLISESNGIISLRSRIQLKRAYYGPEEYDVLREFFNLIVKKHNEQIVFKKKK